MATRVHTGGGKDFVYDGTEEYGDTEPTRQFKEEYNNHLNKPKWKRILSKYKPPKKKRHKEHIHKETIREPIHADVRQKPSVIVAIILVFIIIGIATKLSDGTPRRIDDKLSGIRGTLTPEAIKEKINVDKIKLPEKVVEKIEEIKEKVLPSINEELSINEEIFERKDEAKQAFEYTINEFRREEDIDEMQWSEHSYNLAVFRAKDLLGRDYFEHVTPEGLTVDDYMEEFGLDGYAGENIGGMAHYPNEEVSGSVREVIRQWMVSVGHKQNLLNKRYNLGAVGCYKYICTFIGVNGQEVTPISKEEKELKEQIIKDDLEEDTRKKEIENKKCVAEAEELIPDYILVSKEAIRSWGVQRLDSEWKDGIPISIFNLGMPRGATKEGQNVNYKYPHDRYLIQYPPQQILSPEGVILGTNSFIFHPTVIKEQENVIFGIDFDQDDLIVTVNWAGFDEEIKRLINREELSFEIYFNNDMIHRGALTKKNYDDEDLICKWTTSDEEGEHTCDVPRLQSINTLTQPDLIDGYLFEILEYEIYRCEWVDQETA